MNKREIANQIKSISKDTALTDFLKLKQNDRKSQTGIKCIDFFTFVERLNTKGNKGLSFFDIYDLKNELKDIPYIAKLITFIKEYRKNRNEIQIWKEVQQVYYGSINVFKPLNAIQIYNKYNPFAILDPCAGWGGRLVAAAAINIPYYYGIDLNTNLKQPYTNLIEMVQPYTNTQFSLFFEDALLFDYSKVMYDMLFTSPPYYNTEIYFNSQKREKKDWNIWYSNFINVTFKHLKNEGYYCLNIPIPIYEKICIPLLGIANDIIPLNKSIRRKGGGECYKEFVYVWKKLVS